MPKRFAQSADWFVHGAFVGGLSRVVSASRDGQIRQFDLETGREIVQMISFDDGEWIVMTPEGYYDASINGGQHVNARVGSEVYAIDQFEAIYRRPDIVRLAVQLGDSAKAIAQLAPGAGAADMVNAQPPKIWFVSPAGTPHETEKAFVDVTVGTEDFLDAAESVAFYVNDRLLATERQPVRPVSPGARERTFSRQVPLVIGNNWIKAEVRGTQGALENRVLLVVRKGEQKRLPDLYYVAAGVSEYSNTALSLPYPVKDVAGLGDVLLKQKGLVYADVKSLILTNRAANRAALLEQVEPFLAQVQQEDLVVVFVSGHGMNASSGYHFLAWDSDPDRVASTGVRWTFFDDVLKKLQCSVILLADTCHSGYIVGNKSWHALAAADPNSFLRETARGGVVVFSSSSGETVSHEDASWGHGAFTKALIDGLSGEAANPEGIVRLGQLQTYVYDMVVKLTGGTQVPVIPSMRGSGEMQFRILARKP